MDKAYVHFRLVVEIDEYTTADDAWEQAIGELRAGGGDIIGHSIIDTNGNAVEEMP